MEENKEEEERGQVRTWGQMFKYFIIFCDNIIYQHENCCKFWELIWYIKQPSTVRTDVKSENWYYQHENFYWPKFSQQKEILLEDTQVNYALRMNRGRDITLTENQTCWLNHCFYQLCFRTLKLTLFFYVKITDVSHLDSTS